MSELMSHQIPHFERLLEILNIFYYAFDLSLMGAGKTIVACKVAQFLEFNNVVVFCPHAVKEKWKEEIHAHNLPVPILADGEPALIHYDSLAGRKEGYIKSQLLKKNGDIYYKTKKLDKLIEKGTIFIFDEIQKGKNKNTSLFLAIKAIVNRVSELVNEYGYKSRVLFMSGTLFDNGTEQIISMLKILNIYKNDLLYSNSRGNFKYQEYGYSEIYNYSKHLDPDATINAVNSVLKGDYLTSKNIKLCVSEIYKQVIQKYVTSGMDLKIDLELDCKNEHYNLSKKRLKRLNKSIEELSEIIQYDEHNKRCQGPLKKNMGRAIQCHQIQDREKIEIVIKNAIIDLKENDTNKICLVFNFVADILMAEEILYKYKPLVIYGKTPKDIREKNIKLFNEPNSDYRVLIGNLTVISTGIDLHDTNGNYKRCVQILPNYRAMDTQQVIYRFYRVGTLSVPKIRFIYANGAFKEKDIYDAYVVKGKAFRDFQEHQANSGVIFPGEYETIYNSSVSKIKYFKYHGEKISLEEGKIYTSVGNLIDRISEYKEKEEETYFETEEVDSEEEYFSIKNKLK
uniref:Helicase ATP-binding domain-containing protein n=1 Tax=viral metagenome TaxID=1070528 RepID=A0A6C0ADD1_9ZZZZ